MNFKYERAAIRVALDRAIGNGAEIVDRAVRYAVEGSGRLYRPLTTVFVAEAYDVPSKDSISAAIPVELGNAGSLILDDIADRVSTRRNRPSCWKAYGPAIAQMAAIKLILHSENAAMNATNDLGINKKILTVINNGAFRAINGQIADMNSTGEVSLSYALRVAEGKTAALFSAAAVIGGLVARAPEDHLPVWDEFGRNIGTAFQIKDDLYDVIGDPAKGGKPICQDVGKPNVARIVGVDHAQELQQRYVDGGKKCLVPLEVKIGSLESLLEVMFSNSK